MRLGAPVPTLSHPPTLPLSGRGESNHAKGLHAERTFAECAMVVVCLRCVVRVVKDGGSGV